MPLFNQPPLYLAPGGSGADLTGITAAQVGADASGSAAAAQAAAETYATAAAAYFQRVFAV
jgi:NAD(P)H-hydrate repair Nnr-like enzyme with NAD(P)H-hydrate dehydratase domain